MVDDTLRHADHDLDVVVTLLDREVTVEERAAGEAMTAACGSCATLHADLISLATATRSMPVPARPRAFTLSVIDAARLAATSQAEPDSATTRPTTVMTDGSKGHPTHDTTLIAALADHSLPVADRAAAEALVAACTMCADLQADVVALRNATRSMPMQARPREFTLSEADASRLRPGGWRGLLAAFGTSRDAVSQPLAIGLTTLGLAGLLISGAPSVLQGAGASGASAPSTAAGGNRQSVAASDALTGPAAAEADPSARALTAPSFEVGQPDTAGEPSTAPERATALGSPGTGDSTGQPVAGVQGSGDPVPSPADGQDLSDGTVLKQVAAEDAEASKVVVVAGAFLIIGLSLFAFRWTARRFGHG